MAWSSPWRICAVLFAIVLSFASAYQETEADDNDPGLNSFVSRPDIKAPKWNVKIYNEELLAPGYWFLGPYRILEQTTFGHGWVGAHIYDGRGELIWSGADKFSKGNIEDFRISNVRGEYLMTLMDQGSRSIVILDKHYEVVETVQLEYFNSHELNFIANGTRALVARGNKDESTREMAAKVGWEGTCKTQFERITELDVMDNWREVFSWTSYGKIGLDESTYTVHAENWEKRCDSYWDFLHTNSIDKTEYGDYIFSGRHTDTLYKVSKDDGRIIWRLGGVKSDFPIDGDLHFSRQHDVRVRGENETHLMLSILDNAKGIDRKWEPTYPFSRGLLLAVNEKDMTYSIEKQIDHPMTKDRYSPRRGNYQVLPNGNIFMGWSEQGVQSEHSPDGTILMESIFAVKWLGTYRQYKFPFVAEPKYPPDIHSQALSTGYGVSTRVHVSWNGATEVRKWQLWNCTEEGDPTNMLEEASKEGFETLIIHDGFAAQVRVTGLDANGNFLGQSDVFDTIGEGDPANSAPPSSKTPHPTSQSSFMGMVSHNRWLSFGVGFVGSAVVLLLVLNFRRRGIFRLFRAGRYHRLRQEKDDGAFEPFLHDGAEGSLPLQEARKSSLDDRIR